MNESVKSAPQSASALDLQALSVNTAHDSDLQIEVLQLFFGQSEALLLALREAQDDRAWYEASHALKGGSRSVGLLPLGHLAEEAENMMGAINEMKRKAHCRQIENEVARGREAVALHFPGIF
jgi:HPt (histidine-containing phosphotransfer) domain-containing protein